MSQPPMPNGPHQPRPYGQQPPYGSQPAPYSQPPPYGQQPGRFPAPQAGFGAPGPYPNFSHGSDPAGGPPKRSPLPWIVAGCMVVIAGVVLAIVLMNTGDDDASVTEVDKAARSTTEAYVEAAENGDARALNELFCAAQKLPDSTVEGAENLPGRSIEITGMTQNGDTVIVSVVSNGNRGEMEVKQENGEWCVGRVTA